MAVLVWVLGTAANMSVFFRFKYVEATKQCQYVLLSQGNLIMAWVDFMVQTLLPMSTMVLLYCHMYYTLKKFSS